jgi:single-strand DNA-binding protein
MINKVILIGNLGRDPEIRRFENGGIVARFSLATNENYKDKNGEWQTETQWHDISCWRGLAERAERELRKGRLVYVEGKLSHRKYVDKNQIERYATEVVAETIRTLDKPMADRQAPASPDEAPAPQAPEPWDPQAEDPDALPF